MIPELTKLKELWRDRLSETARDYWLSQFVSTSTQAEIRKAILTKFKINLTRDAQLTEFRRWLDEQESREQEAERQIEEEAHLREQHPDWDADTLRQAVIAGSLRRAIATGDFKGLGLKAVRAGQNEKIIRLDREKFESMERRAAQADQTEGALKSTLTDSEKAARIKEIYGLA